MADTTISHHGRARLVTAPPRGLAVGVVLAALSLTAGAFQPPGLLAPPPVEDAVPELRARSAAAVSRIDGEIAVDGLREPVEVIRDRWGVPHIYAQTLEDLFFAQGLVAAQDRLWQLDLWRRVAVGELAEVFGPEFVTRDTLARLLRFRGDMDDEWRAYSPDAQRIVEAFVRGVNAYIARVDASPTHLPIEFQLTGSRPEPWTAEVVLSRMAGFIMTRGARSEVQRARLAARVGAARVAEFLPPDPPVPVTVPLGLDLADITDDVLGVTEGTGDGLRTLFTADRRAGGPTPWPALSATARLGGRPAAGGAASLVASIAALRDELATVGSNNWAVSGARSVTGRPLLANDPHRSLQLPSLRYTVHLNGPGWNVIGAGEPALPGVAVGHNERVAFGFTIVGIDQQDVYVERLDPQDPRRVEYRGAFEPMRVERASIDVKGEGPRSVELLFTRHGPVLHVDPARHRAYALRWVGTEPGTAGYLASLSLDTARSWEEFRAAAARWAVPSENLVYADVDGNIGWVVGGLTPVRQGWNGLLPVPGHEGRYEWTGFLPATELPQALNPPSGVIVTANHNILPAGYTRTLGYDWTPPHRFERITEVLSTRGKWDVSGFERLQHDEVSLPARAIVEALRVAAAAVPVEGADRAFAVKMLSAWDGTLAAGSAPAALYQLWLPHLQRAFAAIAFRPEDRPHAPLLPLEALLRRLRRPSRDDLATLVGPSLDAAFQDARQRLGDKPAEWAWGRLHQAVFEHPLATTDARRSVLNVGAPAPRGGDATTVNNTGSGARQLHGASFRAVMDVGAWDRSTMINVPGQSGQPGSRHYGDLLPLWAAGSYHPLLFSRGAVEQNAAARLVLRPMPAPGTLPAPYASGPPGAARPEAPPVAADAPPRMPPFAGTLVNFDRRGEYTAACALDPGGGETKRGARAVPNTHVWVFHREVIRQLGAAPGSCDPAWSPNGARLAVVTPNGLWTYSPTLEDPRQLAEASLPSQPRHANDYTAFAKPRWSPDGRRIAHFVTDGAATWIEVVEVATTRRVFRSDPGVTVFEWGGEAGTLIVDGRPVALPR
jgi:penicillin amidase